jgi:hypothetical protein
MTGREIRAVNAAREPDVRVMLEGRIVAHPAALQLPGGYIAEIHALKGTRVSVMK